jgi:hypothetical protein
VPLADGVPVGDGVPEGESVGVGVGVSVGDGLAVALGSGEGLGDSCANATGPLNRHSAPITTASSGRAPPPRIRDMHLSNQVQLNGN